MMEENLKEQLPDHYVVEAENLPPTKVVCKCGEVFTGDDPIMQIKDHMQERNES
jgi:hypothetical protein